MEKIELESFPFDSIVDDREYPAAIFRKYFEKVLTTGVFFGLFKNYGSYSMKVMPDNGLNVKVVKGCGFIKGADFELENDTTLSIEMPIGNNRNDMVVVRLDDTLEERRTTMYVKQGTDTDFAELERTADVYEICLAKIVVQDRSLEITIDDIIDTRRDKELCGIVTSLIDIDIQDILDSIDTEKEEFFAGLENNFNEWFETVQDVLDSNTAGHLLNLIGTKADKKKIWNLTIDTTWIEESGLYKKAIEVEGIENTDIVKVYPVWSEDVETRKLEREEYDKISVVNSQNSSVELICDEDKPNMNLSVRLEVVY